MSSVQIKPGSYIFGSGRANQQVDFGGLVINPVEPDSNKTGQWFLKLRTFDDAEVDDSKMRQIFVSIACRLGLMPVHFVECFEKALLSDEPICLVADTSSLFNGSFEQAVRLRTGKPTHLAIPDQVYMEIQRQRERSSRKKDKPSCPTSDKNGHKNEMLEWLRSLRLQRLQVATARALRRLKQTGMIIYFIRPPQPMVRYFGSERGSSTGEELTSDYEDGLGYHRDRLILEAARNQKASFPHIPVWLVTGDAKLAIQADLEEFQVGYSWLPQIPEVRVISSPYVEPHTLTPHHLPVEEFLEEWLWNWKNVTLQLSGKAKRKIWTLPYDERKRARLELNDLEPQSYENKEYPCERCTVQQVLSNAKKPRLNLTATPITKISVPQRAPPPHNLIEGLLNIANATDESVKVTPDIRVYLQALGWVEKNGELSKITSRGQELVESWKSLNVKMVIEWYEWLRNASQDILHLQPQQQIQEALATSGVDNKLAEQLGFPLKAIRMQLLLANAFGILVRLNGKSCKTECKSPQEAATLILSTTVKLRHLAKDTSSAVRVEKIFTTLLKSTPLSLPNFRVGIFELLKQNKIEVGGTVPDLEGTSSVKMKALIPGKDRVEHPIIDFGAGNFLIPGQSCQVITPLENTT